MQNRYSVVLVSNIGPSGIEKYRFHVEKYRYPTILFFYNRIKYIKTHNVFIQ